MKFPKQGQLVSAQYLNWIREQPCFGCGRKPPSEAHHHPPKGRRRDVDDTRTIPVCRTCHKQAHGETVIERGRKLFPVPPAEQVAAVDAVFRKFITEGDRETVRAVLAQLWREP